jgi:hypothetical protein
MLLSEAINSVGNKKAISIAQSHAASLGIRWLDGICYVFQACLDNPELVPNKKGGTQIEVIQKWVNRYNEGYKTRISCRCSNLPGTIADPIIDEIIQGGLKHLDKKSLDKIKFAHRLSMSAENILGLLLEEYLSIKLKSLRWHCAWGETIRSVDFCSSSGDLLQIKNRSNSENSSSSRVREGTDICKWFRVDAMRGTYQWQELNEKVGSNCSEEEFRKFAKTTLAYNPKALAVEKVNPWLKKDD